MIKRYKDIEANIGKLREYGIQRGDDTGFIKLDELYSIKAGGFSVFHASPTHGKSELIFELLINQAIQYGKRSLIYSPESGNAADIFAELMHKYIGKAIYKSGIYHCTDVEYHTAKQFIDHYFLIVDSEEKAYSFKELTDMLIAWEKENPEEKVHLIMAEPYNELDHSEMGTNPTYLGRQDIYMEALFSFIRRFNKRMNTHTFLSFHPSHQQLIRVDGFSYYPMPKGREAAGGQATFRKAFNWINMWRPPKGLNDDNGMPYPENVVLLDVEKTKPKGVGRIGQLRLYWDWKKNRYYEELNGMNSYAFDHKKVNEESPLSPLTPSKEFNDDVNLNLFNAERLQGEVDDLPF